MMAFHLNEKWIKITNYSKLQNEDIILLKKYAPKFTHYAEEAVNDFYRNIEKVSELRGLALKYSSFDRLKKTQIKYFHSLFEDDINTFYIENRKKIGSVHAGIGLTPQWFLASYSVYLDKVKKISGEIDCGLDVYTAFSKRIFFDSMIILEQYDRDAQNNSYKQKMNELAFDVSRAISNVKDTSSDFALSASNLAHSQESITKQVNDLKKASQSIKQMSDFVMEVATKTNLLGLNASIEAARAGNAGRGFAVVAKEVRKLAEEAKKSSETIQRTNMEIVQKIDHITEQVENVMAISEQQSASADSLQTFVEDVIIMVKELEEEASKK